MEYQGLNFHMCFTKHNWFILEQHLQTNVKLPIRQNRSEKAISLFLFSLTSIKGQHFLGFHPKFVLITDIFHYFEKYALRQLILQYSIHCKVSSVNRVMSVSINICNIDIQI